MQRDDELAIEAEERRRRRAAGKRLGSGGGAAAAEEEEEAAEEEEDPFSDGGEGEEDLTRPYVRPALELSDYDRVLRESWVGQELEEARNIRPG